MDSADRWNILEIVLCCTLICGFFLPVKVTSVAVLVLSLPWFFRPKVYFQRLKWSPVAILFISLFVYAIIGIIYSNDKYEAYKQVEKLFPFVFISLFFSSCHTQFLYAHRQYIYWTLIFASLLVLLYNVIRASFVFDKTYLFVNGYTPFTSLVGLDPVYYSSFVILAYVLLLNIVLTTPLTRVQKILSISALWILAVSVFYVRSRISIAAFLSINFYFLYFLPHPLRVKYFTTAVIILSTLAMAVIFGTEVKVALTRFRFSVLEGAIETRRVEWTATYDVFKEHLLFGTGPGDFQNKLNQKYSRMGFERGIGAFNAHNEYLSQLAKGGIVGGIMFFFIFYFSWLYFWRDRSFIVIAFLILVLMSFTTESMLSRQKGIVFVTFFLCFFEMCGGQKKNRA